MQAQNSCLHPKQLGLTGYRKGCESGSSVPALVTVPDPAEQLHWGTCGALMALQRGHSQPRGVVFIRTL